MTIAAHSIYGNPHYLRDVVEVGGGVARVEASPIYTSLVLTESFSGTRTKTVTSGSWIYVTTQTYTGSKTRTFSRVAIKPVDPFDDVIDGPQPLDESVVGWGYFAVDALSDNECTSEVAFNTDWGYSAISFDVKNPAASTIVIGTEVYTEDNSDPPYEHNEETNDINDDDLLSAPIFYQPPATPRGKLEKWGYPVGAGEDTAGLNYRDLRGTYSADYVWPIGVWDSSDVKTTYGWEIS